MQTSELPPMLRDQRKADSDHLNLLSIFHFVGAGLGALGILFVLAHYAFFNAFLSNPKMWQNQRQTPPPPEFFQMFKWFYLVFGVWFFASLILNVLSGLCIRFRKYRTFSLVVAAIDCLHMPLGTVLGVFTFVVLLRQSIAEVYEHGQNASLPPITRI